MFKKKFLTILGVFGFSPDHNFGSVAKLPSFGKKKFRKNHKFLDAQNLINYCQLYFQQTINFVASLTTNDYNVCCIPVNK